MKVRRCDGTGPINHHTPLVTQLLLNSWKSESAEIFCLVSHTRCVRKIFPMEPNLKSKMQTFRVRLRLTANFPRGYVSHCLGHEPKYWNALKKIINEQKKMEQILCENVPRVC